jgi:hypothetical protein
MPGQITFVNVPSFYAARPEIPQYFLHHLAHKENSFVPGYLGEGRFSTNGEIEAGKHRWGSVS